MALIPSERLTDWEPGVRVGVPGGIDQYYPGGVNERTTLVNVVTFGADPTGVADSSSAVSDAMATITTDDVLYFPAGTFRLDSDLNIAANASNFTIRGAGPTQTVIIGGASIVFGSSDGWVWPNPAAAASGLSLNGTSVTLDDASAFGVGDLMLIGFDDETDNTAIQAGDVPIISVGGYAPTIRWRRQVTKVTGKVGNVLTISPGVYHTPAYSTGIAWVAQLQHDLVGIEDLHMDMAGETTIFPISMNHCNGCWVRNVKITTMANYGIAVADSFQCEIRKCEISERQSGGSNGAGILVNTCAAMLVEDNILYDLAPSMEINQGTCGSVFAYNLCENEIHDPPFNFLNFTIDSNHGPHNSMNLYEGNVSNSFICDGYFGGESELTIYRNWITSSNLSDITTFGIALKRFSRNVSSVGNVMGKTGVAQGGFSYGEPNIGNGDSTGTAEPTTGDFWADWKMTGQLTTRVSDTAGTITLASGSIGTGQLTSFRWNSNANGASFSAGTVSGSSVPFTGATGDALPALNTVGNVYPQPAGFQELDLDVENSAIDKGNYTYGASGAAGSMSSLGGDTLIESYYRDAKPTWFYSLAWPPFDPEDPNASSYSAIPAGYRFLNNGDDPPAEGGTTISVANVTNFNVV